MPREDVFDTAGEPIEGIPTEQEVKDLNTKVEEAGKITEDFGKFKESLELEDGQTVDERLEQMKKDNHPDWSAARKKMKAQDKILADNGFKTNEAGDIVKDETLSTDDIDKKIQDGVKAGTFNDKKEEILSKYNEEDRKVFEHYLDKMLAGEDPTPANLNKAAIAAQGIAFPKAKVPTKQSVPSSNEPDFGGNKANEPGVVDSELASNFGITAEDKEKYKITTN